MENPRLRLMIFVAGLDIGGAHGGAERFGLELSRNLDSARYDVCLCAFWRRGSSSESYWYQKLQDQGLNVFFAADWKGKFNLLEYARGLRVIARHCQPAPVDVIHSNFQLGTVAALLFKIIGRTRQAIRTAHITLEWGEGLLARLLRLVFQNWLYPLVLDAEVGVSQAIVNQLDRHAGARLFRKHAHLIHNAIDPALFSQREVRRLDSADPSPRANFLIGSIGRMTRQKGYAYLIQAMPEVLSQAPGARLMLIGDGDLMDDLKRQALELGLQNEIEFVGQTNDVLPLLEKLDLFVLPSLWEGLPTVLLESMACGIPVLATNIPGTCELVRPEENGWLVPAGDPQALAKAILRAINEPAECRQMVSRAREDARRYSFTAIARSYEALYEHVSLEKSRH